MKAERKKRHALVISLVAGLLACWLGKALAAQPTQPQPTVGVIIDNTDPGFKIEEGEWGTCEKSNCQGTSYGADFRYADPICTSCRARFDFKVKAAGEYDVWTWWPWGEDRSTDTTFTINSRSPLTVKVDQRNSGDDWWWLATLAFEAGESVSIVVEGSTTGYANADAIALTPAGSGPPGKPVAEKEAGSVVETPTVAVGSAALSTASPPPAEKPVTPPEARSRRVIFLHHSVGANLIEQGGVRKRLTALGYELYDHGYNEEGLVLADGTRTGRNFDVPGDNTNPDGFAAIFAQPLHDPPDNIFSHLMQHDVIAFKSCFPTSHIESDSQLAKYRSYYLSIRDRMDQYPNKIFIIVTQPPEIPNDTDTQAAARARAFSNWLASDEYLRGHPNVFTFNFFDLLAGPSDNMLRAKYRSGEWDAHPNELANRAIGPIFSDFIGQAISTYTAR
jgi:hypothetical protein